MNFHQAVIFSALTLTWSSSTFAFNCAEAKLKVEETICASPALLSADRAMDSVYKANLRKSHAKSKLIEDQRKWITEIRNSCDTEKCLIDAYAQRNRFLKNFAADERAAAFPKEYFCWINSVSDTAPHVLEISFIKKPDGSYSNTAFVRKYDNILPTKIVFQKTVSTQETSLNRPLEFTHQWRDSNPNERAMYEVVSQNFPRHVNYFPRGQNGKSVGYEPIGVSSDSSCFKSAVAEVRQPK